MPDLPDVVDSSFPYQVIGYYDNVYMLAVSKYPFFVSSLEGTDVVYFSLGSSSVGDVIGAVYAYNGSSWVLSHSVKNYDGNEIILLPLASASHLWSNSDVFNHYTHNLVLAGTSSLSLSGYNYISWDGSTSDPVYSVWFVRYFFYAGSVSFDSNVFADSLYLFVNSDGSFNLSAVSPVDVDGNLLLAGSLGSGHVALSTDTSSSASLPSGLYFEREFSNGSWGGYTKYFFYPAQYDSSIDFSSTSLTASNPQYDYQSAAFDVSWSNLPEIPYPDIIQYFIQGRLNDGSAAQPPEIYLGSSSDPPTSDVPVSFSFTNLQPETQYTATFELVYNTTGTFRDFIGSGVTSTVSFTTLSDGSISEGDKAIINAIQQGNKDNQQWTDSQFGSAVGDLPEDTTETDNLISGLDQQEEAYKDDAYDRFQELSSAFSGFDGTVGSGIGLAGTLFSRFFNALGSYKIIYTFPLLLGLAMVLIGRLGRSSIRMEREPGDQFKIDGW